MCVYTHRLAQRQQCMPAPRGIAFYLLNSVIGNPYRCQFCFQDLLSKHKWCTQMDLNKIRVNTTKKWGKKRIMVAPAALEWQSRTIPQLSCSKIYFFRLSLWLKKRTNLFRFEVQKKIYLSLREWLLESDTAMLDWTEEEPLAGLLICGSCLDEVPGGSWTFTAADSSW